MKHKRCGYSVLFVMLVLTMFFLPTTWATPQLSTLIPSTTLPDHFDLRDVNGTNYVTGVRDQGPYGTCWTHGVMASMEGNLLMTGNWASAGEEGEPSLSEAHLDWWNGFNDQNNDDDPGGVGIPVHNGGDYLVASAYITRGEGVIREIDAPYENLETSPLRYDSSYHYFYPHDIEWYYTDYNLTNIDTIKTKLMEFGVIGTAFCVGGFMQNYIQYQPPSNTQEPNHAVAIVGWDDTLVTQAPQGPGAWIVKNSWGAGWGHEGYFYISYYDKWCGHHPQMGAVSYQNVISLQNRDIYSYDYHGWRDTFSPASQAFNAFTAERSTFIDAVSFYTTVDNVEYTVKIYDEYSSGQLSGELMTGSGTIQYTGYHTIDLSTPVAITEGDVFYVYVEVSQGGIAFDRTSDVPVLLGGNTRTIVKSVAHPEESYYWNGASWVDFFTYDFADPSWDGTANFCIKAITAAENTPILTFESFTGGKGISTIVKNIGTANATNLLVTINGTGGVFLRFSQTTYPIDTLAIGASRNVSMKVFGFGIGLFKPLPVLTITLSAPDANTATRQITAKIIGPFTTLIE